MLLAAACASVPSGSARPPPLAPPGDPDRTRTTAFARVEDDALDWLIAADPRMALRADATASDAIVKRIGLDAVLAEDTTGQIHGGSLDLFAFRARAQAIAHAAQSVAGYSDPLPEAGPLGTELARPRLERELLERLIAEERSRAEQEGRLGEASGDLVRGIVSTWTRPAAPQDWTDRDDWVSKHLLEIRASLRDAQPLTGPSDLDTSLYPLERLLEPMQFPRGSAAIAEVRLALDGDTRAIPKVALPDRLAAALHEHLGVVVDPATLPQRLERLEARLREVATNAMTAGRVPPADLQARARELLLVEHPCPPVPDSRVRSLGPPPERSAICGMLRAFADETWSAAVLVALHDDVLLSFAAVVPSPRRGDLLSHPEDEDIEGLQRSARERPVRALGVALAADLLYGADAERSGGGDVIETRLRAWRALGEAPLDVVAREILHP